MSKLSTVTGCVVVAAIPACDMGEFARLDDDVKYDVMDLMKVMKVCLADQSQALAHLKSVAMGNAHKRGWSYKRLESIYYKYRRTGDWHDLINKAKQRGLGKSRWMTPAVIEAWKTCCMRHFRSYRSAYIELIVEYKAGQRIGDVSWREVWSEHNELCNVPLPSTPPRNMPLPEGWSYVNFMRYQPRQVEKLGARQGRNAAKELSIHVRTTRDGMAAGMQLMFDDLLHDNKVLYAGQMVRVWELACLDVGTGHKVAYGLKPNIWDDIAQAKQNIRGRDMRLMLAHVLCNVGYHPEGCELHVENGTAAIQQHLDLVLSDLSDKKIRVARSGIDRKTCSLAQWGAKGGGNPNAKAHLESHHNLVHNRLDSLPGQMGNNARLCAPEDSVALESMTNKLIQAADAMPPELARKLLFPVLDMDTFRDVVSEVYAQIAGRTEHALEGWHNRMQRMWRAHITDVWHSEEEYYALTPQQRAALDPIIIQEGYHCVSRKSPLQVWREGERDLVRLPDYAVALICGKDIAEKRACPANGEIVFVDKTIDPAPMAYRLQGCMDEMGGDVELTEGQTYNWLINPFDRKQIFVLGDHGEYVGKCARVDATNRMDTEEIGRAIGRAQRDLNEALAPLAQRGAKIAKARVATLQQNAATLKEAGKGALAAVPETPAKKDDRIANLARIALGRDVDVSLN